MQRSQGTGTIEMMLIPLLKVSLDAPDGLFLQDHNSRTQDIAVGPSGVHHLVTPPLTTGVVQRTLLITLAACTLLVVVITSTLSSYFPVFVPSGV